MERIGVTSIGVAAILALGAACSGGDDDLANPAAAGGTEIPADGASGTGGGGGAGVGRGDSAAGGDGGSRADAAARDSSLPECVPLASRIYDPTEVPAAPAGAGRSYYVDGKSGDDARDGTSAQAAFKTIARAVGAASPLLPGDTLRIKAGLYRERPQIRKSGASGSPIVIGADGDGEVIIDASDAVVGWTKITGSVYSAHTGYAVTAVVVDDAALLPETSQASLKEGTWFYDAAPGDLYVSVPGGADPGTRDMGVIKDDAYTDGVSINGASYVTLYGITVRFASGHGVTVLGDHVRVEKCKLELSGKSGVNLYGYQSTLTTGAEIVKNDIYANVLRNWPRGRYKDGGWAAGAGSNGTPDVLYQGNVVHRNNGEGLLAYGGPGGTTYKDNVVYDNWSVNIYVDNQPNATIESNFIYCHQPSVADLYGNGDPDPGDNKNLKRLRPEGVMTADEDYGNGAHLDGVTIVNNVIVHCRRGLQHYGQATGSGLKNVRALGNTIVVASDLLPEEDSIVGISVPSNGGNNSGSVYRNNVVYGTAASTYLLWGDDFTGVTFDHNLWFHAGNPTPLHWANRDLSHDDWAALPGGAHAAGDQVTDPGLVNADGDDVQEKRPAASSSPAVDRGVDAGIYVDFNGCVRPQGAGFDIGAFER